MFKVVKTWIESKNWQRHIRPSSLRMVIPGLGGGMPTKLSPNREIGFFWNYLVGHPSCWFTLAAGEADVRRPRTKITRVYDPYYCYGSCAGGNGRLTSDEADAWIGRKRPWPVGAAYRDVRSDNRISPRIYRVFLWQ